MPRAVKPKRPTAQPTHAWFEVFDDGSVFFHAGYKSLKHYLQRNPLNRASDVRRLLISEPPRKGKR